MKLIKSLQLYNASLIGTTTIKNICNSDKSYKNGKKIVRTTYP